MGKAHRRRIIVAIVALVMIVALGVGLVRYVSGQAIRTVSGTVTSIDLQTRTASLQIIHAKTGGSLEIQGYVPPDCDIHINGTPAELGALRVGDQAEVEGTLHRDRPITVNWVRVRRPAQTPATEPTTAPSGQGP